MILPTNATAMSSASQSSLSSSSFLNASKHTYYDILHISPTATYDEIKSAYRSLIVRCHPDKLKSLTKHNTHDTKYSEGVRDLENGLSSIDMDDDGENDEVDVLEGADGHDDDETNNSSSRENQRARPTTQIKAQTESLADGASSFITTSPLSDTTQKSAETSNVAFLHIQAAYQCLRDPHQRRQYDERLNRKEERKEWVWKGATEVDLSGMEWDWCRVVEQEESDGDDNGEVEADYGVDDKNGGCSENREQTSIPTYPSLQKVFFHQCRCGDSFQIVQDELLDSIIEFDNINKNKNHESSGKIFTNRVWQCDSCSLSIRIHVDMDVV